MGTGMGKVVVVGSINVDLVVTAGIKAVLNFSPGALKVPADVKLKSVDLTVSLESLSFYLAQGDQ